MSFELLTLREGGRKGVNCGVGAYGMEWVHNRGRERSRETRQLVINILYNKMSLYH